jgi:predicted acylesterase/phospholipase RssA
VKRALVVSGGGSKGAFAIGAMEVLQDTLQRANLALDMVAGTSTGALIAPFVPTQEIQVLRAVYSNVTNTDIISKRNIIEILATDAIFDTTPLWQLINSFITEARYRKIVASPMEVFLTAVNLQSGDITYFNQHTSGDNGGPMTRHNFCRAILASASQPVVMPPVEVPEGTDQYVDGGVREIAPLKIALDHGATHIYAIVLSPEKHERQEGAYGFIVKTLLRTIELFTQEVVANDIHTAVQINRAVLHWQKLRAKAEALLPPDQVAQLLDAADNPFPFEDKRVVEITLIRPEVELAGDSLEFDPVIMAQWMSMGREAAHKALASAPLVV